MAGIQGKPLISNIDLYASDTTTQTSYLGQRIVGNQGKEFVYVYVGGVALTVGNLIQAPAVNAQFVGLAVATTQLGAAVPGGQQLIYLTNGTATITANQFSGGTVVFSTGEERTIIGNTAATSGSALNITIDRGVISTLTAGTQTATIENVFNGVIQSPTTPSGILLGVAIYALPLNTYGWIQVKGVCGALSDNTTGASGSELSNSTATAGAVGVAVAGTTRSIIGRTIAPLSSATLIPILLDL